MPSTKNYKNYFHDLFVEDDKFCTELKNRETHKRSSTKTKACDGDDDIRDGNETSPSTFKNSNSSCPYFLRNVLSSRLLSLLFVASWIVVIFPFTVYGDLSPKSNIILPDNKQIHNNTTNEVDSVVSTYY